MRHDEDRATRMHCMGAMVLIAVTLAGPAAATESPDPNDGRCDACGNCVGVRKVCVPNPKERVVTKTCWSYKCEDFCVPGPSEYCGRKFATDACGCWFYDIWKPTCAEIRTKKVPVKTEVKRKTPGVEWRPEERCAACRCGKCLAPPIAPLPPIPKP